jgi:hypothetical protein
MSRGSNYPEGGVSFSSQVIFLEQRVQELEKGIDEIAKDRDDWARKYQELSKSTQGVKYDADTLSCETIITHMTNGSLEIMVTHGDGTITVTKVKGEK